MIISNAVKSVIRQKGKSALFFALILCSTLALCLCISVWYSTETFLSDCDDFFTSTVIFEYMGSDYPDDDVYDPYMQNAVSDFDYDLIETDSDLVMWSATKRVAGFIPEFWRNDVDMPYRMNSVVVVGNIAKQYDGSYSAIVMDVLHSLLVKPETVIYIDGSFGQLESDRFYILHGQASYGKTPIMRMFKSGYDNLQMSEQGVTMPDVVDVTVEGVVYNTYKIEDDCPLYSLAKTLDVISNQVLINATNDLSGMYEFNQNELYIISGREFNEDEYLTGEKVCIISDFVALRLEKTVGDTISLSILSSEYPGIENSYRYDSGFNDTLSYKIVGIVNETSDKFGHVYIPYTEDISYSKYPIGYTIGHAVVENGHITDFENRIRPYLVSGIRMTSYDQGYMATTEPYAMLIDVVKVLTFVFLAVLVAVCALFGYIYVYRQKETAMTMMMLGTGKFGVFIYFLVGSALLSFIACVASFIAGILVNNAFMGFVRKTASYFKLMDTRYSNTALSIVKPLEFDVPVNTNIYIFVSLFVFILCLISSSLFLVFSSSYKKRGISVQRVVLKKDKKPAKNPSQSFCYSFLSIKRGGLRTAVVPLTALCAVVFFGQFAYATNVQKNRIDDAYDDVGIYGYFSDYKGKKISGLTISAYNVYNLYKSGYVENLCVSSSRPSYHVGVVDDNLLPLFVPISSFATESLQAEISRGPLLTFTNDISRCPEFIYSDLPEISFMQGYDIYKFYENVEEKPLVCIVTQRYMEKHELKLGDTIRVAIDVMTTSQEYRARIFYHYDLKIVGVYPQRGNSDTIYSPYGDIFDFADTDTETDIKKRLSYSIFNSVNFDLIESRDIDFVKGYLFDYGFSQVNRIGDIREFVVLQDASLNNTLAGIKQQIRYLNMTYPLLYTLIMISAYAISYLLTVSRKKEFIIMAGLGVDDKRTYMSFFIEQLILSASGCVLGFVLWYMLNKSMSLSVLHILMSAGFLIFYLSGSFLSVMMTKRKSVMSVSSDKD